jgi:hypothetical protein
MAFSTSALSKGMSEVGFAPVQAVWPARLRDAKDEKLSHVRITSAKLRMLKAWKGKVRTDLVKPR